MSESVLVTGGAGFVGSYVTDLLLEKGHRVRVFDNLEPQVHGERQNAPDYLSPDAEFVRGDILDEGALAKALDGVDVVFHLAALVGVGQSMYQIRRYTEANTLGGAIVLDVLSSGRYPVRKLVVASSMSIYGEGLYVDGRGRKVAPPEREPADVAQGIWELREPGGKGFLKPVPTSETKPLMPTSVYAVTKRDHEEMFMAVGRARKIPTVALRYFNIYGPRQALSNPYTGVAAIFSGRLLNGNPPVIFEDGDQSRDFVHVTDVARATVMAMEQDAADYEVMNVGCGRRVTIREVAEVLIETIAPGKGIEPVIEGKFRHGDIRHCFSDISKIRSVLGYEPEVTFSDGMADLVEWVSTQTAVDRFETMREELRAHGLA